MGGMDYQGETEKMVTQEREEIQEREERKEIQEMLGWWDPRERKEIMERQGQQVLKVLLVQLVHRDLVLPGQPM